MTLIHFKYHHTNCFLLGNETSELLAFDVGWPGTFYEYQRSLKAIGYAFKQVKYALVSHFHPDHAGLVGEFTATGVYCLVTERQWLAIDEMETIAARMCRAYKPIDKTRLAVMAVADLNGWLRDHGYAAEAIVTDSHSPDSISLVLDNGDVLIGDLQPFALDYQDEKFMRDWRLIREKKGRAIFPSHARFFSLEIARKTEKY